MAIDSSNYKSTLKNTSLFGGVEVLRIFIGIVRTKVVAMLIGPFGMGVVGLYDSTLQMIEQFTSMGLGTSSVKDISESYSKGDAYKTNLTVAVLTKLVWLTGIIGTLICLLFSPLLSKITFSSQDYTWGFAILAITLLFRQLVSAQKAIFQGIRSYGYMAKSNVYGNLLGLVISVPLYYFLRNDAIVIVLFIISVIPLLISYYYIKKINIKPINITSYNALTMGKGMIVMGIMISYGFLLSIVASYVVRIFISNYGGIAVVGLYTAGFTLVNGYVGMVFNAMGADYYPRLASVNRDKNKLMDVLNSQIEISLLIIGPIVAIFLVYIKEIVILLYSDKFVSIDGMVYWAFFGVFFKVFSWSLSYLLIAKGDSKSFAINETISNVYIAVLNIVFFFYLGLTGLGISFLISYILYAFQMCFFVKHKYKMGLRRELLYPFIVHFVIAISCIMLLTISSPSLKYCIGTLLCVISILYSYIVLNKRIALNTIIRDGISKIRNGG